MILNLKIAGIVGGFSYYSLLQNKVFNWFQYFMLVSFVCLVPFVYVQQLLVEIFDSKLHFCS